MLLLLVGLRERLPEGPRAVPSSSFNFRSAWNEMSPGFRSFLVTIVIFTLGNSTDAFLLLRAQQLGVPVALLPMIWVVLHVVKMGFSVPGGMLSDRIGRKKVIVAGWIIYALVYAGFGQANQHWHAWAQFAVYGIFFGLTEGVERRSWRILRPSTCAVRPSASTTWSSGSERCPRRSCSEWIWQKAGPAVAFGMGAGLALLASVMLLAQLTIFTPRPDR